MPNRTFHMILVVFIGSAARSLRDRLKIACALNESGHRVTAFSFDKVEAEDLKEFGGLAQSYSAPLHMETVAYEHTKHRHYVIRRLAAPNDIGLVPPDNRRGAETLNEKGMDRLLRLRSTFETIASVMAHEGSVQRGDYRAPMALIFAPAGDSVDLYHLAAQKLDGVIFVLGDESASTLSQLADIAAGFRKVRKPTRHAVVSLYDDAPSTAKPELVDQRIARAPKGGGTHSSLADTFARTIGNTPEGGAERPDVKRPLHGCAGTPTEAANEAHEIQVRTRGRDPALILSELIEALRHLPASAEKVGQLFSELIQRLARTAAFKTLEEQWGLIEEFERLLDAGVFEGREARVRLKISLAWQLLAMKRAQAGQVNDAELRAAKAHLNKVHQFHHELTPYDKIERLWVQAHLAMITRDISTEKVVKDGLKELENNREITLRIWRQRRVECHRMFAEVTGSTEAWREIAGHCREIAEHDPSYGLHGLAIAQLMYGDRRGSRDTSIELGKVDPAQYEKLLRDLDLIKKRKKTKKAPKKTPDDDEEGGAT